jgi:hypothetical protein
MLGDSKGYIWETWTQDAIQRRLTPRIEPFPLTRPRQLRLRTIPPKNSTHSYMNMQTYIQDPTMTVPLVRCSALPMFEGHPLIVTAQLEASQVELTVTSG